MGKKSERLAEELDIVEAERDAFRRHAAELSQENAALRARMGLGEAAAPPVAISRRTSTVAHEDGFADPEDYEQGGALTQMPETKYDDAARAIAELRNPTPSPGSRLGPRKEETLTEVVAANNREREFLNDAQRTNVSLISRIASAVNVQRWDADGSEILERVQRFVTLRHWLDRRVKAAVKAMEAAAAGPAPATSIVGDPYRTAPAVVAANDELARALAVRLSEARLFQAVISGVEAEVSLHLQDKAPSISAETLESVLSGTPAGTRKITRADVTLLRDALAAYCLEQGRANDPHPWLAETIKSEVAVKEFLLLLNHMLLPTLVRLRASR